MSDQIHLPKEPDRDRVLVARNAAGAEVARWRPEAKYRWKQDDLSHRELVFVDVITFCVFHGYTLWSLHLDEVSRTPVDPEERP